MSNKCSYRLTSGRFCKRWANRGHGFCDVHQPEPPDDVSGATNYGPPRWKENDISAPPLARLATPRDLFDVVRESINAVRLGRMDPAQAFAMSALVNSWIRARNELNHDDRRRILRHQMLPTLTEEERLAEDDLESSPIPAPPPAPSFSSVNSRHPASAESVAGDGRRESAPAGQASAFATPVNGHRTANAHQAAVSPGAASPSAVASSEISNLESEIGSQPLQQIDLVAARKARAEKMGWPPGDGSGLQPPITPRRAKPASRSG